MARLLRGLVILAVAAVVALTVGFVAFVDRVRAISVAVGGGADGIVVLTGGEDRISVGVELLGEGRGRRLLISGVNTRHKSPEELLRRLGETKAAARCCVDLGYAATNTIGNAEEAAQWATRWGFQRLIVVTSSHHMPRSLAEFTRAMPQAHLIAHPVPSRHVQLAGWWSDRTSLRILVGEYLKYVFASVRIQASRMVQAIDPSVAGSRTMSGSSPI